MKTKIFLLLVVPVFLFSCNQEENDWQAALEKYTLKGFKEFLAKYPESSKIGELDFILYSLIEDFPKDEKIMIYNTFRMREEPNMNGKVVRDLKKDEKVKVLTMRASIKDEIVLQNYKARDYWYEIETSDGKKGWTFGAGFKMPIEYYQTCQLYVELFPESENIGHVKHYYELADCNFWEEVKKENTKSAFKNYTIMFPENGRYIDEAYALYYCLDTTSNYRYEAIKSDYNGEFRVVEEISISLKGDIVTGFIDRMSGDYGWNAEFKGKRLGTTLEVTATFADKPDKKIDYVFTLTETTLIDKTYDKDSKTHRNTIYQKLDSNGKVPGEEEVVTDTDIERETYIIENNGVAGLKLGMSLDEIKSKLPEFKYERKEFIESVFYVLSKGEQVICSFELDYKQNLVNKISLPFSKNYATKDGVRVGSTLAEVKKKFTSLSYKFVYGAEDEMYIAFSLKQMPNVEMWLNEEVSEAVNNGDNVQHILGNIPETLKISGIYIKKHEE